MNNFKKLTEDIKNQMLEKFSSKAFGDFFVKAKADESTVDTGSFRVVISTEDQDRQGDIVLQSGWDLTNYKNNPVVLWAHNYFDLPIGVTDKIYVENNQLIAEGRFASHAFAQDVRKAYDEGMLPATSVGFIQREAEGNTITRAELLEFSFVPVPANPGVRDLAKQLGINIEEMIKKGVFVEEIKTQDTQIDQLEVHKEIDKVIEEDKVEEEKQDEVQDDKEVVEDPKPQGDEEKKGLVSDELNREMPRWQVEDLKYDKLCEAHEVYFAFCNAYLDDSVPVESFSELLKETADLLTQVANGEPAEKMVGKIAEARKSVTAEIVAKATVKFQEKSGRVLSEKNRGTVQSAIDGMKTATTALEDLLVASEGEGEKSQEIERSKTTPGSHLSAKQLQEIAEDSRKVLQLIATVTSESLANIKKSNRK